jgi:hypothetical protein
VIETYSIGLGTDTHESVSTYLLERWQAGELGYRAIATLLNKRMLRTASIRAGRQVTQPQIDSEYAALMGDDDGTAAEIRDALGGAGVDVDSLETDFLSHMAIRRHFRDCLGATSPDRERDSESDWQMDGLTFAREQFQRRLDDLCRSLAHNDIVSDADTASIQTPVYLRCDSCPTRTPIEEAIEQGYVCARHQ